MSLFHSDSFCGFCCWNVCDRNGKMSFSFELWSVEIVWGANDNGRNESQSITNHFSSPKTMSVDASTFVSIDVSFVVETFGNFSSVAMLMKFFLIPELSIRHLFAHEFNYEDCFCINRYLDVKVFDLIDKEKVEWLSASPKSEGRKFT